RCSWSSGTACAATRCGYSASKTRASGRRTKLVDILTAKRDYALKQFASVRSFDLWLSRNHATADGIRIQIAKKSSGIRIINYAEALEIALCYGWIDGQSKSIDDVWYWQRFTPRRSRSLWS